MGGAAGTTHGRSAASLVEVAVIAACSSCGAARDDRGDRGGAAFLIGGCGHGR
jgi:hypothetical protein